MELKWLEDFVSLANTRSFTRSADERNITQSAFSRRVKALELWLGAPVVNRDTFPLSLTPAGEMFLETARRVIRDLKESRTEVREHLAGEIDTLIFAALHTLSLTFFPRWISQIERDVGPLRTRLIADNRSMDDYVLGLQEGSCDFLLCYATPRLAIYLDAEQFPSVCLANERLIPVTQPDSDGGPIYSLDGGAATIPFLRYAGSSFLGQILEVFVQERGAADRLTEVYQTSMAEGLKAMLLERPGLAWLPQTVVDEELGRGKLVPAGGADWEINLEVRLYRARDNRRNKVDRLWQQSSRPWPTSPSPSKDGARLR